VEAGTPDAEQEHGKRQDHQPANLANAFKLEA